MQSGTRKEGLNFNWDNRGTRDPEKKVSCEGEEVDMEWRWPSRGSARGWRNFGELEGSSEVVACWVGVCSGGTKDGCC